MPKQDSLLVALLKEPKDFGIVLDQGWYRIPVTTSLRLKNPKWLAFYFPAAFGDELKFTIRYFGKVAGIDVKQRKELFPNEPPNPNSNKEYYRIQLKALEQRARPIVSKRGRRVLFIPTTLSRFQTAEEINDLFIDSPLEDLLWSEFRKVAIDAERQYELTLSENLYRLDFAIFCQKGQIDVETDGDFYHSGAELGRKDNLRNNDLTAAGWQVLRFNTSQIREKMAEYTLPKIKKMINKLGGLETDGEVARRFIETSWGSAQQLSLFGNQELGPEDSSGG